MMNGNYPGMMGNFGWGFGGMFMGLLTLIIVLIIIFFVYKYVKGGNFSLLSETPLDILKKRYAKGELSKEEFEKMKNDLQ
jgi:putative membrane protein